MLRITIAKRLACLCAAIVVLFGCISDPADGEAPAATESDATNALSDQSKDRPGVPRGCEMVWSPASRDSVVNCPDIRPPSPR